MKLSPNQPSESAKKFFNESSEHMAYLAGRWADEKEYENINDYKKSIQKIATKFDVVITKMTKFPFGCQFTVDERTYVYTVKLNGIVECRRIA